MSASQDLQSTLVADGQVAALVGARVRFDIARESDAYPFVILRQVGNEPIRGLDGSLHARRETFHVESWGETRSQSADVHQIVENALVTAGLEPDSAEPDALDPDVGARACVWVVDIWS